MSKVLASLQPVCAHPSWVEIDLKQFQRNLAAVRRRIGNRLLCLPVKGNAYGHGLCQMAKSAEEAGVDSFGVSCLKEGISLRLNGISRPILVFGAIHEDQIQDLINYELEFSISSKYKAQLAAEKCRLLKKQCRIHLEVDTGIQRTGVRPATLFDVLQFLKSAPQLQLVGIYSHMATADAPGHSFACSQIASFRTLMERVGKGNFIWHLASSGGVAYYPESHFDMVRPGLICYGYFPDGKEDPLGEIAPCLSLKSKVSYFKVVGKGEGISYGHHYRTSRQTRVVTVPIGYGDGYRRSLSNRAPVLIRDQEFQVAGLICMDQFMVDIGDSEVFVGDEVTLIGRQGEKEILLWELARLAGTIPNELLCSLNDRLPRIYCAAL